MGITTAPATITVDTGVGDTVANLDEISDLSMTYRAPTLDGSTLTGAAQPRLTITRQRENQQNKRHQIKAQFSIPTFDITGSVVGYTTVEVRAMSSQAVLALSPTHPSVARLFMIGVLQDTALDDLFDTGSGFR